MIHYHVSKPQTPPSAGAMDHIQSDVLCWGEASKPQMLRVESSDGRTVLLPYTLFVSAFYAPQENGVRMTLTFGEIEVDIVGQCLTGLLELVQRVALEWVSAPPQKFALMLGKDSPFIRSITVRSVNRTKRGAEGEVS
jgi:hypothetical protein